MLKSRKISENVIKIVSDSNCYIVEERIVIDTSQAALKEDLLNAIKQTTDPKNIKKVIFTHLHYDHIGNADLFPNAEFFACGEEIKLFNKNKVKYILDPTTSQKLNIELKEIEQDNGITEKFDIFRTPGHCSSCIVLHYKKDNVLFTGDTYFHEGCFGRVDLPTSEPEKMETSLKKVNQLIDELDPTIAPGHDY